MSGVKDSSRPGTICNRYLYQLMVVGLGEREAVGERAIKGSLLLVCPTDGRVLLTEWRLRGISLPPSDF
jgi:hypothetical protein